MAALSRFVVLLFIVFFSNDAFAKVRTYEVSPESTVEFSIPYTFGTHEGISKKVSGFTNIDFEKGTVLNGKVRFPISSLTTGDEKLDCHMREALGLRYENSAFPKKHVCSKDNKIPESGPNAIAFPEISFTLDGADTVQQGQNKLHGTWLIHGREKGSLTSFSISDINTDETGKKSFVIAGKQDLFLKDYEIKVKPFLFVKVKDRVSTKFRLVFVLQ